MQTSPSIALVTGGSRGLGKSTALHLARQGHDVILTYRSKQAEANDVVAQIEAMGQKAVALALNVSDSSSFAGFAAQVRDVLLAQGGRTTFNVLINNAGTGTHASLMDTTEVQFDELVNVHFKGAFFLTQKLLPLMADGGRIVNLSSGLTRFALPGYAAYASMKGAVEVMTRYMAKELGPRGIAVNTVAPGAIATDFGGGAVRDTPQLNAIVASQTALGRVGEADDIGAMVASLVSPANRWINAQRIEVSGGMFV
ncbi:short-chain dehydrogenase/reductase SDR [Rhodoferax ferrireducens T118]|uniref:Short-chain dehydrogenase/reductase SDR n=1 Tax=Albidiferax ferrireducens (strain ATCC BAA-621 / DSM 15236 / T118) TaxID=338969 RepID=Q21ZZ4_ALBFT|nr:SDR family oxidoreductase [Rhodoferax ferrireducens]ABD68659.1 short-chain dehydrogenase/reductase SDR [Rhodoferax ferrireducens T118]